MAKTEFHWQRSDITPDFLMAVGGVTLNWAQVDNEVTRILQPFWFDAHPEKRMPRSFDKRVGNLVKIVEPLYADEPEERRIFKWYIQRLKDANGQRDNIAHGIPGTITKGGRTFQGLMVPYPSREPTYAPKPLDDVAALAKTIDALWRETLDVTAALYAVRNAASGNIRVWQNPDGWSLVTMDNRSPRLPLTIPPPPTFRA